MSSKRISQIYCGCICAVLIGSLAGISMSSSHTIVMLVVAVTVIGLPHGALDFAVANMLGYCTSVREAALFIAGYLAIVVFSLLFWLWLPSLAMIIFLTISAHHFSTDWRGVLPYGTRLSLAIVTICGPSLLYSSVLESIFDLLFLPAITIRPVITGMQLGTIMGLGFLMFKLITNVRQINKGWQTLEIAVLLISSIVLTPLLHFALYFCLLHSFKHFTDTAKELNVSVFRALRMSLPFVVITLLGVLLVDLFRPAQIVSSELVQYVFIGLFGLTVAHMLLIEIWYRRRVASH